MQPPATHDKITTPSPAHTLIELPDKSRLSFLRRYSLLLIFCLAQFLDAFNNSALFSAIPAIKRDVGVTDTDAVWLVSAFSLTFASFLLLSGRISDVYDPKYVFASGLAGLGLLSLGGGFVNSPLPMIILRALTGCAAALTIPSALALLVNIFPDRQEQARAIGAFGACGAIGNVSGLIIGALFVQYASWRWCFWFVACAALPAAAACLTLVPRGTRPPKTDLKGWAKVRSLDLLGVAILTAALVLLIYAVTCGSTAGWATAGVLAPLIVSIFFLAGFFYYETLISPDSAAVPPKTWFYPNFAVLFFVSLLPYFWWGTVHNFFITLWQQNFHWSAISTAVHIFPIGVIAFAMSFTGSLSKRFEPKWLILGAQVILVAATVLFNYTTSPESYWPYVFPAFVLGSGGAMVCYTHTNIAIFRTSPSSMAGTVGAIFNGGLQLGSAVGYAACGSVQNAVDTKQLSNGGGDEYAGRRAAFRVLLGFVCLQVLSIAVFMRTGQNEFNDTDSLKDSDRLACKGAEEEKDTGCGNNGSADISLGKYVSDVV